MRRLPPLSGYLLVFAACFVAACSKHDPAGLVPDAARPDLYEPPLPPVIPPVVVPPEDAGAAPDGGAKAPPSQAASAAAVVLAAPTDGGVGCGTKPLPDCPLQAWMKGHVSRPATTGDLPALEAAFDAIARMEPVGLPHWATLAKDGQDAASAGNLSAARAACRGCHEQYRARYRAEMRARPLP